MCVCSCVDVTLVLTHRCNLDCVYCYAGEHHRTDMDEETLDGAVDLLFADGSSEAQLSFFGGEPFLARDAMRRAVTRATWRAEQAGARLRLQCTTNGAALTDDDVAFICATDMRVTVSIDGVRDAHELTRPTAGNTSSFDRVAAGLRSLIAAGARPQAMMVITPATVSHVYRSVCWLWDEGVERVLANVELSGPWDDSARYELEQELLTVGWELMARRSAGRAVVFDPFGDVASGSARQRSASQEPERQVAVATSGNLYPCAPMVGDDRDTPARQRVRIGALSDGIDVIARRVEREGTRCNSGGACECAAFLETGDRGASGPMGLWYARTTREIGASIAAGIEADRRRAALGDIAAPDGEAGRVPMMRRRGFLASLAVAAGGLAIGGAAYLRYGIAERQDSVAGKLGAAPYAGVCELPEAAIEDPPISVGGATSDPTESEPEPEPAPEPVDRPRVPGRLARPVAEPPPAPPPEIKTRGELRAREPRSTDADDE